VRSARCESLETILVTEAVPQLTRHSNCNAASFEVLANRNASATDSRTRLSTALPIVTANGFTLLEGSRVSGTTNHRFRVLASTGVQQNISVCFDRSLVARVDQLRGAHLWIGSRFWGFRAQEHLEAYLLETANYPPNGQLVIDELSEDELLLAAHWRD
jgi:hypothetical protein